MGGGLPIFSHPFIIRYMCCGITDTARLPNGVGIYVWRVTPGILLFQFVIDLTLITLSSAVF